MDTKMKFDLNPKIYDDLNGAQFRDAKEMLEKIQRDGIKRASVIIDIGCGSGNVTELLAAAISHDKMVAFDINPEMTDFASKRSTLEKAEFLTEDISQPWENLHATLQSLEGKVDLVWSNRVFHWIPAANRPQAAKNLMRLLKPGGRCYLTITGVTNFNDLVTPEERAQNEKLLKIPSAKEQQDSWTKVFSDTGLSPLTVDFVGKQWSFGTKEQFQENKNCVTVLAPFLTDAVPKDQQKTVLDSFVSLFLRGIATPFGESIVDDAFVENCVVENYGLYRVAGLKP